MLREMFQLSRGWQQGVDKSEIVQKKIINRLITIFHSYKLTAGFTGDTYRTIESMFVDLLNERTFKGLKYLWKAVLSFNNISV